MATKYYSKNITTAGANEDIIATLRTASGDTAMTDIKKITIKGGAVFTFKINGGATCEVDSTNSLLLTDVHINKLVVVETAKTMFVGIEY